MYQVLIADDEQHIVNFLVHSISWKQFNIDVIHTAYTGSEALKFLREQSIDLVITDIRMPGINGLELCKEIRAVNSTLPLIIISGFADFNYAKEAINHDVLGYCLKPIDIQEITYLIKKGVHSLGQTSASIDEVFIDAIENNNEALISNILNEAHIDKSHFYLGASMGCSRINTLLYSSLSIHIGRHSYIYFSNCPMNKHKADNFLTTCSSPAGIGLLPNPIDITALKTSLSIVRLMACHFFFTNTPTVCMQFITSSASDNIFEQLGNVLAKNNKKSLRVFLKQLSNSDTANTFNLQTAFKFCNFIYSSSLMEKIDDQKDLYLYSFEQLTNEYSSFSEVLREIQDQLKDSNDSIISTVSITKKFTNTNFMHIIKYINGHYQHSISLKNVAEAVHMNSNYISQLFKKETGITYTQYLTELRINKAKQLLETSELSIGEVSEAVGFNDYFYFLKTFKKFTGTTPGKYVSDL